MNYFLTRIYSLNILFPYAEKITTLLIEKTSTYMNIRFLNGTNDIQVALKAKYYPIQSLQNDLDYFNEFDMYALKPQYEHKKAFIRNEI
jgi:hypothetical protein